MGDRWISAIVENTPNLEQLGISYHFKESRVAVQTKDGFLELAKLKKLKHLELNLMTQFSTQWICSLMESFEFAKVPIEKTILFGLNVNSIDIRDNCKFETINRLSLHGELLENNFIYVAMELPQLTGLTVCDDHSITANGLIEFVKFGKQLNHIVMFGTKNLHINERVLKDLLSAVQHESPVRNLFIEIFGYRSDVPQTLIECFTQQLKVNFY